MKMVYIVGAFLKENFTKSLNNNYRVFINVWPSSYFWNFVKFAAQL